MSLAVLLKNRSLTAVWLALLSWFTLLSRFLLHRFLISFTIGVNPSIYCIYKYHVYLIMPLHASYHQVLIIVIVVVVSAL